MPTFPMIQGGGCASNSCVQQQLTSYGATAVNSAAAMLCIQIAVAPYAHCVPVNGGALGNNPQPIAYSQGKYVLS